MTAGAKRIRPSAAKAKMSEDISKRTARDAALTVKAVCVLAEKVEQLEQWKDSAIASMLDHQAIAKAIGCQLGFQVTTRMVVDHIRHTQAKLDHYTEVAETALNSCARNAKNKRRRR